MNKTGIGTTSPVGAFPMGASPYGIMDMSGNVWEWTRSIEISKSPYPYIPGKERDSIDPQRSEMRVLRGGAFHDDQTCVRCACRDIDFPILRYDSYGFRVVVVSHSDSGI